MRCSLFYWTKRQRFYLLAIEQGKRRVVSCNTADRAEAERILAKFIEAPWGPANLQWGGLGLTRSQQNRALAQGALTILQAEHNRFAHILTRKRCVGLLAQLGRIGHPESIKTVASEICQYGLKGHIAERYVIKRRSRDKSEFNFGTELARQTRQLMKEWNVSKQTAISYLSALQIDLQGQP